MSFIEKNAIRNYNPGDTICKEGDEGSSMFIIQTGKVEVSKIVDKKPVQLAELDKGAIFGEMSLIDGLQRSATVMAKEKTSCLEINKILFNERMEDVPPWMRAFYEILVDRLRKADATQNTLSKADQGQQIVYLLYYLLSHREPDKMDRYSITWKETAETIAFLTNIPEEFVNNVMNKLSITKLVKSEVNFELGRQFVTENLGYFESFAQYCREQYFEKIGKEVSTEFAEQSRKEMKLLKFIGTLMSEQATASDLDPNYFEERIQQDLDVKYSEYEPEVKALLRKGILSIKRNPNSDKYYHVDREILDIKLGRSKRLDTFKKIATSLAK